MKGAALAVLTTCVLIASGGLTRAAEPAPKPITVDAAAQIRFGLSVTALKRGPPPGGAATTARVLDPSTLLQLDSELASAAGTFAASRAEAARTRKLFEQDRTASA